MSESEFLPLVMVGVHVSGLHCSHLLHLILCCSESIISLSVLWVSVKAITLSCH